MDRTIRAMRRFREEKPGRLQCDSHSSVAIACRQFSIAELVPGSGRRVASSMRLHPKKSQTVLSATTGGFCTNQLGGAGLIGAARDRRDRKVAACPPPRRIGLPRPALPGSRHAALPCRAPPASCRLGGQLPGWSRRGPGWMEPWFSNFRTRSGLRFIQSRCAR